MGKQNIEQLEQEQHDPHRLDQRLLDAAVGAIWEVRAWQLARLRNELSALVEKVLVVAAARHKLHPHELRAEALVAESGAAALVEIAADVAATGPARLVLAAVVARRLLC